MTTKKQMKRKLRVFTNTQNTNYPHCVQFRLPYSIRRNARDAFIGLNFI